LHTSNNKCAKIISAHHKWVLIIGISFIIQIVIIKGFLFFFKIVLTAVLIARRIFIFLKKVKVFVLVFLVLLQIIGLRSVAKEVVFTASTTTNKVGMQNTFPVIFQIQNVSQVNQFRQPNFTNFKIVGGPMQSSSFSNINGNTTTNISFTFYLQPKTIGRFTIPAASANADGKQIESNTLTIEVLNGNLGQQPAATPIDPFMQDEEPLFPATRQKNIVKRKPITAEQIKNKVFARVDIDKTKVFVGQQVTACYNVYSQLPLEAGFKKLTSPDGCWSQDDINNINPQQCERMMENGKEYRKYTLRKTALFPSKAGEIVIPPVTIQANVDTEIEQVPTTEEETFIGSIMNQIFSGGYTEKIPIELQTKPVIINATALPSFELASTTNVGLFTLEGNLNKTEITDNETAELTLIVKGTGNIKLLTAPKIDIPGDFEKTDAVIFDTLTNTDNVVAGYKIFKYYLSPRNAGDLFIPAASFTFFNTTTNQYETLTTPSYAIKVKPSNALIKRKVKGLPQDIHDIINDQNMQINKPTNYLQQKWYWALLCLPLLFLFADYLLQFRKKYQASHLIKTKNRNINAMAQQRLSIAKEMLHDKNKNGFYNETSKVIWLFISDKLSIPLSKLKKEEIWHQLQQEGVESNVIATLQSIITQCEEELYAVGSAANMQQIYTQAEQTINYLENKLG
jgi:BatD DUF11 like domain